MTTPERIGKYTITEVLGKGSMGTVYKAFDPHIHRQVAIKTVHKELLGDVEAVDSIAARFRNEAKAVGRLVHPGVVAIYEFGEDENDAYIAMEFVEGRSLDDVLAATPMLPQEQLLHIMDQLLDALGYAHAHGVWHRDVKPANLILTNSGQVKLTDFGVARIADASLTQVSSAIGTPSYMAPEQFRGEGVDHRADLFACGVVLYRLLTGKRPFTGNVESVMYKILADHPPPPSEVTGGARPAAFDAIVASALAKRADDRFQSAQEMREALRAIAGTTAGAEATNYLAVARTPPAPPAPRPAAGFSPASVATTTGAGQTHATALPAGWDPAELSRIERALASHVGPMARLMVRDAARSCADSTSLVIAVARHIPEEAKRQHFLGVAQGGTVIGPGERTGTGTGRTGVPAAPGAPVDPLTEDFKAVALQAMTRRMGPIAKVMVKRAAEQSGGDKQRFVQKLLEAASDADRTGLQRDLGV
jgi:serine/threonine-protein kinase